MPSCRRTSCSLACNGRLLLLAILASAEAATTFNGRRLLASTSTSNNNTSIGTSSTHDHADIEPSRSSQVLTSASTATSSGSHFRWDQFCEPGEEIINLIVVFKHQKHLAVFNPICNRARLLRRQHRLQRVQDMHQLHQKTMGSAVAGTIDNGSHVDVKMTPACAALLGSCRHIFKSMIPGFSGKFTRQQFDALQHCAGAGAIDYIERDAQVTKAEAGNYHGWWQTRPPTGTTLQHLLELQQAQQQQQQQDQYKQQEPGESRNASDQPVKSLQVQIFDGVSLENPRDVGQTEVEPVPAFASVATSNKVLPAHLANDKIHTKTLVYSNNSSSRTNNGIGSSNSTHAAGVARRSQLWRWVLAEVGLSAQQQLASGSPAIKVIAAAGPSGKSAGMAPVSSTSEAAAGEPVPVVSAAEAAGGGGVVEGTENAVIGRVAADGSDDFADVTDQGRVTKNQDPGLAVDPAAIANPDIVALSPHDGSQRASASSDQQPLPQQQVNTANEQPGIKVQKLVKALWNLDRIDQRKLPLNGAYSYGTTDHAGTGKGVTIYTVDSGIRSSHQEFQPWGGGSSRARVGPDFVDDDDAADDCDGHGTHVSSTAAGRSVGVAKDAAVVGVRVLDCDGAGSISNVVAALEWVGEHAEKPAVASMSLGVQSGMWSRSLETAVKNLVATGITVVVAAGNSAKDSCQVAPARVAEAFTVGASNLPNKFQQTTAGDTENLYRWSNTGACVDVFAPGVDIYGACGGPSRCESVTDNAYTWASGTSMAAPHVTGLIAVYLEAHPQATPAEVHEALVSASTTDMLQRELMLPGTPNRLLFSAGSAGQVE